MSQQREVLMTEKKQYGLIILGLLIALGMSCAGYFIGQTLYNSKVAMNTAEVKGLAERRIQADMATWDISLTVSGEKKEDIPNLYQTAESQQQQIINLLKENGIQETEISPGVFTYSSREFRDKGQVLVDQKHKLINTISIETRDVKKLGSVRSSLNKLIAQGVDIKNNSPRYLFTSLNDIKPAMLKEATKNARVAAEEFAANAGVRVGKIRSARQGNFYVRDIGSDYSDYKKIEKNARVVTTITFYLN